MELKEYQSAALDAFTRWLDALDEARVRSESAAAALRGANLDIPDEIRNYPKVAWGNLAEAGNVADTAGDYVDRTDDAGRHIPHICFKVPTGGGKTLLAAAALERMNKQNGLVLWITPTRAIYEQTRAALRDREHPYRQMLERASGGRVKFMEKDYQITAADTANYLCVMLLSLPAANRNRNRDFLRMFRDSGRYPTLFPDGDDPLGAARLLNEHPDLERVSEDGPAKHSLFNAFKMLRPVVILDEAHKAYGSPKSENNKEFVRAVNRLDPSLVIELSATPNRGISNLLVDISGVDLKNEEMIKLPVQVSSFDKAEWQYVLAQAHEELERLESEARSLQNSGGDYIRPIAVVRVERTGRDQRDGERVHAEDVREYLNLNLSVPADSIKVKSSANDELGNEDLLSDYSRVRWIITKAALMEGWDCPFAYLLVMLDNTSAQRAITQLVGRVMRQPYARRTERQALDNCYVYCWNTSVGAAVQNVKNGLEREGMTGLGDEVFSASGQTRMLSVKRRVPFQGKPIFLPKVLHKDGDDWIELDYQRHILPAIDWESIREPDPQAELQPETARRFTASVDVGDSDTVYHGPQELHVDKTLSISWFARRLSDIVPNPWQAARIAGGMIDRMLSADQTRDSIYDQRSRLAHALRDYVRNEVERSAEKIFQDKIGRDIRFDLQAGQPNFAMSESYELPIPDSYGLMAGNDGRQVQLSLFDPIYNEQFDSELERSFARYLDEEKALRWWHRVAVRQRGDYYLRGWKPERIWPDFIAMAGQTEGKPHLLVFETKGEHLKGNDDTDYKRRVFETLEKAFNVGSMTIADGPAKGTFRLIFTEEEFPQALANLKDDYTAA